VCRSTCLPFCNICALGFDLAGTGTIFPVGPQAACGELSTLQRDMMLPSSSAAQPRGVDRRQPTPSGGAMQERPPEKEPAMGKTVLIVEDNELNMKLFQDLLEAHGYETIGTRNGVETLELARRHRPDLILMDIQLPEVSGLEVTKWLKEDAELKAIPVIAVTAF